MHIITPRRALVIAAIALLAHAAGAQNGNGLTGRGPGVIEVPYDDLTSDGGNYVLYVQVQRVP